MTTHAIHLPIHRPTTALARALRAGRVGAVSVPLLVGWFAIAAVHDAGGWLRRAVSVSRD